MLTLEVKIDASPLATSPEEIKAAIEKAIKEEVPCQLYSLEITEK